MVTIFTYIIGIAVSAFTGFVIAALVSSNKYEEEKYSLQAAIDKGKADCQIYKEQVADLTEEKAELHG